MQVSYSEGVANHTGPESCVCIREDVGEALTGERIGQPSSRENLIVPSADVFESTEGKTEAVQVFFCKFREGDFSVVVITLSG